MPEVKKEEENIKRARVNTFLKLGIFLLALFIIWYTFSLSTNL